MLGDYCQFSPGRAGTARYSLKCSVMAHFIARTLIWWSGSSFHGLSVPSCHKPPGDNACLLVSGRVPLPIPP